MQPKFNQKDIRLIIGLGNPDHHYENTYHNVGFLFVKYLESLPSNSPPSLKSTVFMNESGSFVSRIVKKQGVAPQNLLIIHDDSDISLGDFKFSFGSGTAGHKGVASVASALDTKDFWRLRIGIRSKPNFIKRSLGIRPKAGDFVLKKINTRDKKTLTEVFEKIISYFS